MSRTRNSTLKTAKKYSNLLLYEATGGILGVAPIGAKKTRNMTFAEKKGLLTELLKLAELEKKHKEDEVDESPFAQMKRGVKHGSTPVIDGRSEGNGGEDTADELDI
jgi:hypothetical protein